MRKTKEVVVDWGEPVPEGQEPQPGQNRDHGKRFLITEMSAYAAEKWAMRLTLAMSKAGIDVPEGATTWGAILAYGAMRGLGGISWAEAEPLLDEMWACVQIVEEVATRKPTIEDVEELQTRLMLRREVFDLHAGFFTLDVLLKQWAYEIVMDRMSSSQTTQTSHPLSEPSSQAERPN